MFYVLPICTFFLALPILSYFLLSWHNLRNKTFVPFQNLTLPKKSFSLIHLRFSHRFTTYPSLWYSHGVTLKVRFCNSKRVSVFEKFTYWDEIVNSKHLCSLEVYWKALIFILKANKYFSSHSDYPVTFAEPEKLNSVYIEFERDYASDCSTADHLHKGVKDFKFLKFQNATSKQNVFIFSRDKRDIQLSS